jgi:hypothetical protein
MDLDEISATVLYLAEIDTRQTAPNSIQTNSGNEGGKRSMRKEGKKGGKQGRREARMGEKEGRKWEKEGRKERREEK